jgi:hypothetical protein
MLLISQIRATVPSFGFLKGLLYIKVFYFSHLVVTILPILIEPWISQPPQHLVLEKRSLFNPVDVGLLVYSAKFLGVLNCNYQFDFLSIKRIMRTT